MCLYTVSTFFSFTVLCDTLLIFIYFIVTFIIINFFKYNKAISIEIDTIIIKLRNVRSNNSGSNKRLNITDEKKDNIKYVIYKPLFPLIDRISHTEVREPRWSTVLLLIGSAGTIFQLDFLILVENFT